MIDLMLFIRGPIYHILFRLCWEQNYSFLGGRQKHKATRVLVFTPAPGYVGCGFQSMAGRVLHMLRSQTGFPPAQERVLQSPECQSPDLQQAPQNKNQSKKRSQPM